MKNNQIQTDSSRQPLPKGIHISRMNGVVFVVSCLLSILLTATASSVSRTLRDTYNAIEDFVSCSWEEDLFMRGSDYMTEQARLYTMTADQKYMDNYLTDVLEERLRETSIDKLSQYDLDVETMDYLQSALDRSNDLMERELYAIRLTAESQSLDAASLPQLVRDVGLTEADRQLTPEDMRKKAQDIVLSTEYQEAKEKIANDVQYSLATLNDTISRRMQGGYNSFQRSMVHHRVLIGLNFAAVLIGFIFTLLLVILPMMAYVRHIKAGENLRVVGAYECKCLAQTCNTMFARNAAHENRLRHQAEHDALTGLLNRGAFDALKQKLQDEGGPVGLLIIDVDKFKLINDGYGHETGDQILQKVASQLAEYFQSIGSPARIGGDEFSVVLTGAVQEQEREILSKIEEINRTLTHPADGLPVISLSVGGAFAKDGFTDDLYKRADLALYEVKEHGRCGCRFYRAYMAEAAVE